MIHAGRPAIKQVRFRLLWLHAGNLYDDRLPGHGLIADEPQLCFAKPEDLSRAKEGFLDRLQIDPARFRTRAKREETDS